MYKRIFCLILCLMLLPMTACAPKEEEWSFSLGHPPAPEQLATAMVPRQVPYPDYEGLTNQAQVDAAAEGWRAQNNERRQVAENADHPTQFYLDATATLLTESEGNAVYSPLNLYLALALLSETTDGESRAQILNALHCKDMKALRENADLLWRGNYRDDGVAAEILGNALFLNMGYDYEKEALNNAAEYHHADVFTGVMGQFSYDEEISKWINGKTGNLLKEQAESIRTESDDVMMLISTLYFSDKWSVEFNKESNINDIFHAEEDRWVEYLHQQSDNMLYYNCNGFDVVERSFASGSKIYLYRPDEGEDVDSVITNDQLFDPVFGKVNPQAGAPEIDLYLPKFDITCATVLIPALRKLGISDIMDSTKANFSPLLKEEPLYLSDAHHDVRVMLDEEGCKAAAITVMTFKGTSAELPEQKKIIEFRLNRPFVYIIVSSAGDPLFVGVMRDPRNQSNIQ